MIATVGVTGIFPGLSRVLERLMKGLKIPQCDSILELARFWDTHDVTDFEDQLEEVNDAVFEKSDAMKIHLRPDEADTVRRLAKSRGISLSDLLQEWILMIFAIRTVLIYNTMNY